MAERYPLKPSLDGPRNKLIRAREHLKQLTAAFERSQEDHKVRPYLESGVIEQDGWLVCRVKLKRSPPPDMSLIAGDAVHNMRTALDHLACQLVTLNNKKPSRQTSFPIYDSRPTIQRTRQRYTASVKGMRQCHKESIKKLQPFELSGTQEGLMLSRLGALDNLDKHRMIPPAITAVGLTQNFINSNVPIDFEPLDGGEIDQDEEVSLARFRRKVPGSTPFMYSVKFQTATRVTLGMPDIDAQMLDAIHDLISGIVESFGPEFS